MQNSFTSRYLLLSITLLKLNIWVFTSGVIKRRRSPTFDARFTFKTKKTLIKAVRYSGHSLQELWGMAKKIGELLDPENCESTRESCKDHRLLVPPRETHWVVT